MREKLTTYIEKDNKDKLKRIALDEKCSVSDIIDDLVKEYLEKRDEVKGNQK